MSTSRFNISPNIWGPSFWKMIHFTTIGYPETPNVQDTKAVTDFFFSLRYIIPCEQCREHYTENLQKIGSPPINSRDNLILWGVKLHNTVSMMLHKKPYTLEKFLKQYGLNYKNGQFSLNGKSHKSIIYKNGNFGWWIFSVIILIIILICGIFFYKKNKLSYKLNNKKHKRR